MKILYIQLCSKGIEQKEMTEAIRLVNPNAEFQKFDWLKPYKEQGVGIAQDKIIKLFQYLNPGDLVFTQVQRDTLLTYQHYSLLSDMTTRNIKIINWSGDVRNEEQSIWYDNLGRHIYCTCFTNMEDVARLKRKGIRSEYLQIGFETSIFKPNGPMADSLDVVFMGNHYANKFPLSEERKRMVMYLIENKFNFKIYGKNWYQIGINSEDINYNYEKEASVYRASKIAINHSHFIRNRYTSDRLFRAMGSGCFVLSRHYPGIEEEFDINNHLDVWNNFDELKEKINYYLNNEEERLLKAKLGCDHVHSNHSWLSRTKDLKRIYKC